MAQYSWEETCPHCGYDQMECWSESRIEGPGRRCLNCGYYSYSGQLTLEEVNQFRQDYTDDMGGDDDLPPLKELPKIEIPE